jgi:hypothetical protein
MKSPVLITGSHRSGKSYMVNGININNNFNLIHEPLNAGHKTGWIGLDINKYYTYINESNSYRFKEEFTRTIDKYKYRVNKQIEYISSIRDLSNVIKDIITSLKYKLNNNRPLIDDPFAVFSAEWFYREFNADVVIMIRHPASFVSSLKLLNYKFPFSHLLDQNKLVEDKLKKYEPELVEFVRDEKSIVEQGELLWRMIYDVVSQYKKTYNSDWFYIKFEDIVRNPEVTFENIYRHLGLTMNSDNLKNIKSHLAKSDKKSDKEAKLLPGSGEPGYNHSIEDHLTIYKKVLTPGEISYIKDKSKDIWQEYYSEEDWV